jgi:hypothetical protein
MIDVEGRPPGEVAALLEVSPVTARWHLMAGRRKLRRLLAPLMGVPDHAEPAHEDVKAPPAEAAFGRPRTTT